MSQPGGEAAAELPEGVERPEDDDHDLLTFGEAGARLEIELRTMRARLSALEGAHPRDETWKHFALVGRDLAGDMPLSRIPLIHRIAEMSARAYSLQKAQRSAAA